MNYADLTTNITEICESSFTADQLAMFVQQAEQKIYNTVQLPSLRRNMIGSFTANNKYLSLPDDLMSIYSIGYTFTNDDNDEEFVFLMNKDVNFIREAYPIASVTGPPKHYAIFGPQSNDEKVLTVILGPTPDLAYETELHFYYYPESIVTANTTWLGDNFDSALLNGSLIEAIRFQKGEQADVAQYEKMYGQAIALLKNLGDGKLREDSYRSGQVRYPVA